MKYIDKPFTITSSNILRFISLILLSSLVLFLPSCSKDTLVPQVDTKAQFQSGIETSLTRSEIKDKWTSKDEIGIYMLHKSNPANNIKYTPSNIKGKKTDFKPALGQKAILFPEEDKVDFLAYFPYQESITNYTYLLDLENESDMEFIFSNENKDCTIDNKNVELGFESPLFQLNFKFATGFDLSNDELAKLTATISGISTTANFNLKDGVIEVSNINRNLDMAKIGSYSLEREAVLFPQDKLAGSKVDFKSPDGTTYTLPLAEYTFEAGYRYEFTVYAGDKHMIIKTVTVDEFKSRNKPEIHTEKKYKIGDYYYLKGQSDPIGIVFRLKDPVMIDNVLTSNEGQIVSIDINSDLYNKTHRLHNSEKPYFGILTSTESGQLATSTIISEHSPFSTVKGEYEVFEIIYNDYNNRTNNTSSKPYWFLPSQLEMQYFYEAYSKNTNFKKEIDKYKFEKGEHLTSSLLSRLGINLIANIFNTASGSTKAYLYQKEAISAYVLIFSNF